MAGLVSSLQEGASALVVTHGGFIEISAAACAPHGHAVSWDSHCGYCEGVRLAYDKHEWVGVETLRLPEGSLPPGTS